MLTIADCIRKAVQLQKVSDSPRLDVELLLCAVLQKSRTWIYTWPEAEVSPVQASKFAVLLNRRVKGEPIAHILGEREFWSMPLRVNEFTLIPRPETELLVETVLELDVPKHRILDLGTGTGAIALALGKELPECDITAVDRIPEAVQLARQNCVRLNISNVEIIESDWFSSVSDLRFDIIVSNPPYIAEDDAHLQQGDVVYEPQSALVAGKNGLADIEQIIERAKYQFGSEGVLLLEHGWKQAQQVRDLLRENGYDKIETRKDIAGQERVTLGYFSEEAFSQ